MFDQNLISSTASLKDNIVKTILSKRTQANGSPSSQIIHIMWDRATDSGELEKILAEVKAASGEVKSSVSASGGGVADLYPMPVFISGTPRFVGKRTSSKETEVIRDFGPDHVFTGMTLKLGIAETDYAVNLEDFTFAKLGKALDDIQSKIGEDNTMIIQLKITGASMEEVDAVKSFMKNIQKIKKEK